MLVLGTGWNSPGRKQTMTTTSIAVAVVVIAAFIAVPLSVPNHVFSPQAMADIARKSIALGNGNSSKIVDSVVSQLREKYPQWIIERPEWMFNNAGGAMGSMLVLHASMSEYVIIFGSAIGTEGHTGRFLADDWFTILAGEQVRAVLTQTLYSPVTTDASPPRS